MKKIGILYICTGKYSIFWKDFYLSMEKNFITNKEKHYFVFTDNPTLDFEDQNPKIHKIYQENLGWPDNTLMRFHIFLKIEKDLQEMDYLFFFNANLLILEPITDEDFLPTGNTKLVATIHPGFFNKNRNKFTYDRNIKSTAYIAKNQGEYYFAGGLNGGYTADFIGAMKTMRDNVDIDKKNNIIARWHDESHWNKYLLNRMDIKMLPPSYLYPENSDISLPKIILIRDKNKYGGHDFLRDKDGIKSHFNLKKIKSVISKYYNKYLEFKMVFFKFKKPIFSNLKEFKLYKSKFILITIAFNNSEIIKFQYLKIKENLKEDFKYIVVDNSNIQYISNEILEYCRLNNIPYIKLPRNNFIKSPSKSHGQALNWSYRNIIQKYKPTYFGFIDHDIIPFKETYILDYVKNSIWGLIQERKEKWYLWPGFSFYKYEYIKKFRLNFMPSCGLDTGGSNYEIIYKRIKRTNINIAKRKYFNLDKNIEIKQFDNSNNTIEIIGDWIHIMRISNWSNDNNKHSRLKEIIDIIKNNNIN